MLEILKIAVTGSNIIPTFFLGLILVYWLIMILGLVNLDTFNMDVDAGADVDVDVDVDAGVDVDGDVDAGVDGAHSGGVLQGLLLFLNVDYVPFMIVMSIFIFFFWFFAILVNVLPIEPGGLVAGLLLVPCFLVSLFITKGITTPLVRLFKTIPDDYDSGAEVTGRICTILKDLSPGRLGQAELNDAGKHLVVNVKTTEEGGLKKGETALVMGKDKTKNFYNVVKFSE
jgi:hypothetical protein